MMDAKHQQAFETFALAAAAVAADPHSPELWRELCRARGRLAAVTR